MAFKMKGSAFKLGNVATKSALKQWAKAKGGKKHPKAEKSSNTPLEQAESPMKRAGIYEIDELTGERKQISRGDYESRDGGSFTLTGKDSEYVEGRVPISPRTGKPMTEKEFTTLKNRQLAKDYELTGPKGNPARGKGAQRKAAIIDDTIQTKINKGIELTPEEKEYQRLAISNLNK